MRSNIMSIIGGKAENPISHKQKMIKIRLRVSVISEKFRAMIIDFHSDHALQILDIRRINF